MYLYVPCHCNVCLKSIGLHVAAIRKLFWARRKLQTGFEKVKIVWMIFGRKLLRSFSMSAIFSFLKYLRDKQTSSSNLATIQLRFGSPRRDPFSYPSRPLFGSRHILWEPLRVGVTTLHHTIQNTSYVKKGKQLQLAVV